MMGTSLGGKIAPQGVSKGLQKLTKKMIIRWFFESDFYIIIAVLPNHIEISHLEFVFFGCAPHAPHLRAACAITVHR